MWLYIHIYVVYVYIYIYAYSHMLTHTHRNYIELNSHTMISRTTPLIFHMIHISIAPTFSFRSTYTVIV